MKRLNNCISHWVMASCLAVLILGCSGKKGKVVEGDDTLDSGTIHISVDESFKPVIDSQLQVFHSQFPNARIIAHYKSEAECLKDLMQDSIRLVIVTRQLSEEEVNFYQDTLEFPPMQGKLASDAIAVIVNREAKDSVFDVSDIRGILDGTSGYKYKPVFDGLTATSAVRFAMDSILRGKALRPEIQAAASSEEVIRYVSTDPQAIGFVGVSWIGNHEDPKQLSFQESVRIAAIECTRCPEESYVKPYQANIVTKRYPFTRGLYFILKENFNGLGRGFVNFLQFEKGQLIFRRAYLVPSQMDFTIRRAEIRE